MSKFFCNLLGGIGNNMFQIATMESLAKDKGLKVFYIDPISHFRYMQEYKRTDTYNPFDYFNVFKNFHWQTEPFINNNVTEVPFAYVPLNPEKNTSYWGYFQSEKYFKHNREFILNLFEPSEMVQKELEKYNNILKGTTCSIHVRRGDYLSHSLVHYVQNMDYYVSAANLVGEVDTYIVCSDDLEWCKKMFLNDNFFFNKKIVFIENEKDYVELFLMSKCTHNIISNSSFSWWSAWLNRNENKKVIAPKKWWSGYSEDIIPENWIKL